MINHIYLEFWKKDMKNIQLVEKKMKTNLYKYMETNDIKYIEFFNKNMQELLRLKQTTEKYYEKIFNQA